MFKLLDAVNNMEGGNVLMVARVKSAFEDRLDWLNDREPESDGVVYDAWEEKVNDLEDIIDLLDEAESEDDENVRKAIISNIIADVKVYQMIHGGLSRLKLY